MGLEAARVKAAEMKAAGIEPERLDPLERARRKPGSLRLAINAKCYDCGGRDADPGWRERIRTCVIPSCSLYPVRPYQAGVAGDAGADE